MTVYIGIDWGTSNFRAYLFSDKGEIKEKITSDKGLKSLRKNEFEAYLTKQITPWQKDEAYPIILCGMVGSQKGWQEVSYIPIEQIMDKLPSSAVKVKTQNKGVEAYILCGVFQEEPADVMRGEETQIFGFLQEYPDYSGYIILPGTHSKWVYVKKGKCLKFHTFMTGELYAILNQYSILSSMIDDEKNFDKKDFYQGFEAAMEEGSKLTSQLFSIRAQSLLQPENIKNQASYLSGLLIGQEFSLMRYEKISFENIVFIGKRELTELYQKTCKFLNMKSQIVEAQTATVNGLYHCIKRLKEK